MNAALLGWAAIVAVISAVAIVRRARLSPPGGEVAASVFLVRPCAGAEDGLERRLTSVLEARRPAGLTVRFSVTDPGDSARPAIEAAVATLTAAGLDAAWAVVPADAANLKAAQLVHWLGAAEGLLVSVDSDVDLTGRDLHPLCRLAPDVGAVWAAPVEVARDTLGDRASAAFLNASLHAFSLLGALDPNGLVGKVFAVRVDAMRAAGGFDGLEACLGEDMEIARRLRAHGLRSALVGDTFPATPRGRTVGAVISRYARWLAVIRAQRPALLLSYPLLFGATLPLVIGSALVGAWPALSLALGARLAVAVAALRFAGQRIPLALPWVVLLGECVTWAAFLRAAGSRTVVWRGRRLRVGRDGLTREA